MLWQTDRQNPFRTMSRLQRQFDRVFDDLVAGNLSSEVPALAAAIQPACDIEETDAHYLMSFDMPGMRREDIQIAFSEGQLRVSGERKDEREKEKKDGSKYRSERYYGALERIFTLPQNVNADQIEAHFENGVLHVAIPKAKLIQPKHIPIAENKGGIFSKLLGKKEPNQKGNAA
jgi:HSP20 family protein